MAGEWMMQRRKQIRAPKSQKQKNKRDDEAHGQPAARRHAQPAQDEQRQINEPEKNGPDHLRVRPVNRVRRARQMPSGGQPHRQKDEPGEDQPDGDDFQALDGREQRQHGAQLVEFQIMLLHQEHGRRDRAQSERAVGQQNSRGVQAHQRAGKFRLRPARRVQLRHQREHADGQQHRRRERAKKPQPRQQADDEIRRDNRPRDERRGLVKIVDRAVGNGEAALDHRRRVQRERGQQEKIIRMVVPAKPHPPQENRIHRARAVKRHGEQKEMPVGEPSHEDRLSAEMGGASCKRKLAMMRSPPAPQPGLNRFTALRGVDGLQPTRGGSEPEPCRRTGVAPVSDFIQPGQIHIFSSVTIAIGRWTNSLYGDRRDACPTRLDTHSTRCSTAWLR